MDKTLFTNALLVTPDGVKKGELLTEDGIIRDISDGGAQGASGAEVIDLKGVYLIPGIIELHTDNLEKHLMPRPKIDWPDARSAVFAHDAQIIAAGITTVCDAMSVGEYYDKGRVTMMGRAIAALSEARGTGMLRSDHYLHLRCELPYDRMQTLFREVCDSPVLRLISLMDHTPGQRQWRNLASYRIYHSDYKTWTDEEFREAVKELQEQRDGCADDNAAFAIGWAREHHIPMASHDDTTADQVREAVRDGMCISEFPTTMEAAETASQSGLCVTMGAPNIVRGKSSSGNVSAMDVAKAGCLGSLSSDYVPVSLLEAVFILAGEGVMPLHRAIALVTSTPASLIGLTDRGSLTKGLSADMVHVRMRDGRPLVCSVWRKGQRVF